MVFINNITTFPFIVSPISNIGPFTYSDGITYLEKLERMRQWLNDTLVPTVIESFESAVDEYQTGITNAETTITGINEEWDARFVAFMANFVNEIKLLNEAAIAAGVTDTESVVHDAVMGLIDAEISTANTYTDTTAATLRAEAIATEIDLSADIALKLPTAQKAAANGVASLGADGKVPSGQLPAIVTTLAGTYAARPVATSLTNGTTYYATDVAETYRTNGAVWTVVGHGGNELGYTGLDGSVPQFTTTSETYVSITNLTMNITPGERPVTIKFDVWAAISTPAVAIYAIFVDGFMFREFAFRGSAADVWETFTGEATIRNLAPGGSNIVTLRVKTSAGTTSRTSGAPYIQAVSK